MKIQSEETSTRNPGMGFLRLYEMEQPMPPDSLLSELPGSDLRPLDETLEAVNKYNQPPHIQGNFLSMITRSCLIVGGKPPPTALRSIFIHLVSSFSLLTLINSLHDLCQLDLFDVLLSIHQ